MSAPSDRMEPFFGFLAGLATRRKWWVVAVSLVLTALAFYASLFLRIDTSTDEILSRTLPFRQTQIAYDKVFPRREDAAVVIDAPGAREASLAASDLAERLRGRKDLFERVDFTEDAPYFRRNGLLFLDQETLTGLLRRIRSAQSALLTLADQPDLRGFAGFLELLRQAAEAKALPDDAAGTLQQLARVTQGRAEGQPATVDWQGLFEGGGGGMRGTRRVVLVKPVVDNSSLDRVGPALAGLREAMNAVASEHPGVRLRVTGEPALRQQELNDAFSGAIYASGLSFVLVALSLFMMRSWRLVGALIVTLVIGSIWTTGLAAVTVGRLNLISVAFMVLFFGLGVDFGTHLGLRYLEEMRAGGPVRQAIARAMMGEGPGITLSAVCAGVAFLSFVPTSYTGLAEFGIISALGMLVGVVITFTILPTIMALMPPRPKPETGIAVGLGGFIKRHFKPVLVLSLLVTAVAGYFATGARLDVNPLNLQDPATEPVRTYHDLAEDPETSPYGLSTIAANLDAARALAERLKAVEGVGAVRTVEDFIPKDQGPKLEAIEDTADRLKLVLNAAPNPKPPTDAELASAFATIRGHAAAIAAAAAEGSQVRMQSEALASALARFEEATGVGAEALRGLQAGFVGNLPGLLVTLKDVLSPTREVGLDDLPPELRREWLAPDGRARVEALPAADIGNTEALGAFARRVQAVAPQSVGVPVMVVEAGEAVRRAFIESILYTAVIIAVIVALLRRRLSDVILVLAPLALASLWTVAASAVLGLPFNFANVIVIPLLVGLGVASSVHIVVRAREVKRDSTDRDDVLDTSTPLAVFIAQINTAGAFATLAISKHQGLYSMGVLLGLAIVFVLIASLVVLPAVLILLERWHVWRIGEEDAPPAGPGPAP